MTTESLHRLAAAAGVAVAWTDVFGASHTVSEETLRAILAALDLPADSDGRAEDSLHILSERNAIVTPLLTGLVGHEVAISSSPSRYKLELEDGRIFEGVGRETPGGSVIPAVLEAGYHRLTYGDRETLLAIAPSRCFTVPEALDKRHGWGLAVQVYALRRKGDCGIGDLTALAEFARDAAGHGADAVAISPLHAQFSADPDRFSPYAPSSRTALNVLHASIASSDNVPPHAVQLEQAAFVDWPAASRYRLNRYRAMFDSFTDQPANLAELEAFRKERGATLECHALFEALHSYFFGSDTTLWHWRTWPEAFQNPASSEVLSFAAQYSREVSFHAYLQFLADQGLADAQRIARECGMGIGLISDLAVGTDSGGSQCWSRQQETLLGLTVGAPPDLLQRKGQNWGLTAFSPHGLIQNGFLTYREMLETALAHAGGMRIDHAMGLNRLWVIPDGADGSEGSYLSFPEQDLLRLVALESYRHKAVVLAEDLGTVPEGFTERLRDAGIDGMRVLWFERDKNQQFTPPAHWTSRAAAMTSTHDLPTVAGWWKGRDIEWREELGHIASGDDERSERSHDRQLLWNAMRDSGAAQGDAPEIDDAGKAADAACVHVGRSACELVMLPVEDALALTEQPNLPGTLMNIQIGAGDFRAMRRICWMKRLQPHGLRHSIKPGRNESDTDEAIDCHGKAAVLQGLSARPGDRARAVSKQSRHQPSIRVSYIQGTSWLHPWLRHRRSQRHQSGVGWRAGTAASCRSVARAWNGTHSGIVPNHMGVGGADNAWWLDVLEWGRSSKYAEFFDVDWDPPDSTLRGRMLAPFLGQSYGEVLAAGELSLKFDDTDGRLFVDYFDNRFPIDPRDYAAVLLSEGGALEAVARRFGDLPTDRDGMRREAEAAREELRRPEYAQAISEVLKQYNAQTEVGRDHLHRLLDRQNFRLAWWRAASDEINWRRFFDVNALAGIRAEVPTVFDATHATILRLYAEGLIDGVRVDHVDGLADPRGYCRKLRRRLEIAAQSRPAGLPKVPAVLWVEKILATHERMPTEWATDGTTGYDFMNDASGVLHDPDGETEITRIWTGITGRPGVLDEESIPARRQILRESLSSELFATSVALHRIARRDLATRDYTFTAIIRTLTELLAHFRVYRIYAGPAGMTEADKQAMDWAVAGARRNVRATDRHLLELVVGWLAGDDLRSVPAGSRRRERLRAMVRFQQLSAPTAAKSLEDTTFYRYGRLISRNEVGTEPSQFALTPQAWHSASRFRRARFPRALLSTATHDHKRGEDARARLAVISEIPAEWEAALGRWMRLNAPLRRDLGGPAPDATDEVMLYETLIGAWPLDLSSEDREGLAAFRERVEAWQQKALREAKRHSGWAAPNEDYEQACQDFLAGVLDPDRPARVVHELHSFVQRVATPGALNGLSQAVLRVTAPGVPDLYQGTEFWDFSLVDPDNRRPVDYGERASALKADGAPAELLTHWRDGHVKQVIIHRALRFREQEPELFAEGSYIPLEVEGSMSAHVLAFARWLEGKGARAKAAITVVSRLAAHNIVSEQPLITREAWDGTTIVLPRNLSSLEMIDKLATRGESDRRLFDVGQGRIAVADILADLPVALLEAR